MKDPRIELFGVHYGPIGTLILNELAKEYPSGAVLSIKTLANRVYTEKYSGEQGPDDRLTCVKVMVSQCRKKIEPLGWTITRYGYRLERLRDSK